jgi:carboxypeptidase PM20D1
MSIAYKALIFLLVIVVLLAAIVVTRALTWRSDQLAVAAIPKIEIADAALARLAGAIRVPTVSAANPGAADSSVFDAFHRHLETSFPRLHATLSRELVGSHSLLYTWKGQVPEHRPMLILAHMDVVPVEPGTEAAWSYGPFSGEIAQGFVWGRGTLDDKGSLMAILEAVELLLGQGFQPKQTVYLAFGHDEELGGEAGARQMAEMLMSRGVHPSFVLDEGLALTQGIVPGIDPPAALVGIAEKGSASLELSAGSPGGHSSMPPKQTAIGIVAAAVHALEDHPMPAALDGPAARLFDRLGPDMPFTLRLALANRWLFGWLITGQLTGAPTTNALVRTTTAATIIEGGVKDNVLPERARAVINFRIKPGDTVESILAHVRSVVNDKRVAIKLLEASEALPVSRASGVTTAGFKNIERTIRQLFPRALVAPALVVGATDSRHYQAIAGDIYRFTPFTLGPDDTRRFHGTNERIATEDYRDCIRFYAQLLINANDATE